MSCDLCAGYSVSPGACPGCGEPDIPPCYECKNGVTLEAVGDAEEDCEVICGPCQIKECAEEVCGGVAHAGWGADCKHCDRLLAAEH